MKQVLKDRAGRKLGEIRDETRFLRCFRMLRRWLGSDKWSKPANKNIRPATITIKVRIIK